PRSEEGAPDVDLDLVEVDVVDGEELEPEANSQSMTPIRPDLGPPAPGPQSGNQPGSGLGLIISVAVAAVVFVLSIYATGSPTANPLPLAQTTNALFWIAALALVAGAGLGAVYADRVAFRGTLLEEQPETEFPTAWIVPVVATSAAILLVATYHNTMMIVAGPLIAFVGNAGSLLSRDLLDDADDSALKTATTIHALVVHTMAFLALSAIYLNKLPTPIVALLAAAVTTLLVIEALERRPVLQSRKLLLAILAGGAVAAVATPLMWWLTHGWTGGAVLFVAFYCVVGVIQTVVAHGTLRPRDAIEFGLVSLAAFIILAVTA
ncbi:MAG: hypothetical protein QM692_16920, partial [Thermomicrobiales bacterium]